MKKQILNSICFFISRKRLVAVTASCVALAAVYRLTIGRIEGNLALLTAISANGVKHLSATTSSVLSDVAAGLASLGLVLEALLCIELLLTCGEYEVVAAFLALQSLVLVHVVSFLALNRFFCP
jgi:hypothetical protein